MSHQSLVFYFIFIRITLVLSLHDVEYCAKYPSEYKNELGCKFYESVSSEKCIVADHDMLNTPITIYLKNFEIQTNFTLLSSKLHQDIIVSQGNNEIELKFTISGQFRMYINGQLLIDLTLEKNLSLLGKGHFRFGIDKCIFEMKEKFQPCQVKETNGLPCPERIIHSENKFCNVTSVKPSARRTILTLKRRNVGFFKILYKPIGRNGFYFFLTSYFDAKSKESTVTFGTVCRGDPSKYCIVTSGKYGNEHIIPKNVEEFVILTIGDVSYINNTNCMTQSTMMKTSDTSKYNYYKFIENFKFFMKIF